MLSVKRDASALAGTALGHPTACRLDVSCAATLLRVAPLKIYPPGDTPGVVVNRCGCGHRKQGWIQVVAILRSRRSGCISFPRWMVGTDGPNCRSVIVYFFFGQQRRAAACSDESTLARRRTICYLIAHHQRILFPLVFEVPASYGSTLGLRSRLRSHHTRRWPIYISRQCMPTKTTLGRRMETTVEVRGRQRRIATCWSSWPCSAPPIGSGSPTRSPPGLPNNAGNATTRTSSRRSTGRPSPPKKAPL